MPPCKGCSSPLCPDCNRPRVASPFRFLEFGTWRAFLEFGTETLSRDDPWVCPICSTSPCRCIEQHHSPALVGANRGW